MRPVQLRAFHYVALYGGFSRAAAALHLTQPAISDQVRKLEQQYDVLLFQRQHKPVRLTDDGERLLAITRRLFDAQTEAEEFLAESRQRYAGRLRIVADSVQHISALLSRYRDTDPAVDIVLRSGNSQQVLAELDGYRADLGVLGVLPPGLNYAALALGATPLIAFVAQTHALAARAEITFAELAQAPLVLRERGSKTRQTLEHHAAERGLTLHAAIVAEGREAVREIVAEGAGVGVVSTAEFGHDPRLQAVAISDCEMLMAESLVCLRDRAGVGRIKAFFAIAKAARSADIATTL